MISQQQTERAKNNQFQEAIVGFVCGVLAVAALVTTATVSAQSDQTSDQITDQNPVPALRDHDFKGDMRTPLTKD